MSMLHIRSHTKERKAVRVYHSIPEALRVAQTQRVWRRAASQKDDDAWSGCSWKAALDLARFGWREGAVKVRRAFASLPAPTLSAGMAWRWDYSGERIDMSRFCSGDDACFRSRSTLNRGRAKCVRLLVPMGYPCSTGSDSVLNRGAAIIAIVDALEMTRRTVEVVAAFSSTSDCDREPTSGYHMNHLVTVKAAGQPLVLDTLAFYLCHRASLRRIGFALMETVKEAESSHSDGYGYGCDIHPDEQSPVSVALPELHGGDWDSPEQAHKTLAGIIQKSGHELTFR